MKISALAAMAAASFSVAAPGVAAADGACLSMGGMGNYTYDADGRSGTAAMAGALAGGVTFTQIGAFEEVGPDSRLEGRFQHLFVTEDGSTLRTEDVS